VLSSRAMGKRFPFTDFPSGWYVVGLSSELPPKAVRTIRYFGRELVIYRTESGRFRVTEPYCPHLGGHLGQGAVDGENLCCGFHGWKFDGSGNCVRAYGQNVPKTKVDTWRGIERNQTLMVWYDGRGEEPTWEPPAIDRSGWTDFKFEKLEFASHPQETSENSVDFGHFTQVHAFSRAWVVKEAQTDGPVLTASYGITKQVIPAIPQIGIDATFHVQVHGLGFSYVQGEIPALKMRYRYLILSTPVSEGRVHMRLGTSIERYRSRTVTEAMHQLAFRGLVAEVESDMPIWEAKRYVERPILARGDGPIHKYRKWARQFYPPAPRAA
jgi:phenylpropionate dioxygenase-like ring-hydroxylating dioxygenase large terminal subunit